MINCESVLLVTQIDEMTHVSESRFTVTAVANQGVERSSCPRGYFIVYPVQMTSEL